MPSIKEFAIAEVEERVPDHAALMPTVRESLQLHIKMVLGTWWHLAIGTVAAVIGVITDIRTDLEVPLWVWLAAGVGVLVAAEFAAFRRLHIELTHRSQKAEQQLAGIEAESNIPYMLSMKPLSASFDIHTFSHNLETSQRGLAVRCVIGTVWDGPQLEVTSAAKIAFRDALGNSRLESWLSNYFEIPAVGPWRLTDPTGEWIATVSRGAVSLSGGATQIEGRAILEVPYPGSRRGWIATIADIGIRAVGDEVESVWGLADFCRFADVLIESTADLHADAVSVVLGQEVAKVAGPVLALAAHSANLDQFVRYPEWDRATGAVRSSFLTMDAGTEDYATDAGARRTFILSEIRSLLSREGFVGFENDLEQLLQR